MTVVTLIGKTGCHLCDEARAVVATVLAEFGPASVVFEERSILDEPALYDRYAEEIPVLLIDGAVHNIWRVEADRLRAALKEAVT